MTLPDITVWPFLLLGAALCGARNWRAGLAFAVCVLGVKSIQFSHIAPQQLYFFALYSFVGIVVYMGIEKTAGVVLCVIGIIYATHLVGLSAHSYKLLFTELALFLGMLICAINGPTGGFLARNRDNDSDRYRDTRGRGAVGAYQAREGGLGVHQGLGFSDE